MIIYQFENQYIITILNGVEPRFKEKLDQYFKKEFIKI